ncbi:rod shape-determining protein MreD [Ectothiorhodospiraceae bacterium 2226]|nr:rod shape-determining protein MreD [Ectothiorhodospiraceae bacterium 2226]
MKGVGAQGVLVIGASFAVALALTVLPLPGWTSAARPEWVALVLIYWCMAVPSRVGVGVGWGVGLLLDVMRGAVLGQHALSLAIVAYLTLKLHQRVRVYPLWQQALSILVLIALHQMILLWIRGITGQAPAGWDYWTPSLTSMLLWPWLFLILRDVRRRFQIS